MWLPAESPWLSVDSLGTAASWGKVIKSKHVIWRAIKALEIGLCTQWCEMYKQKWVKLLHLLEAFPLSWCASR